MHRFFVARETLCGEVVRLPEPVATQVRRVLRLRSGDEIALFCGDGWEHRFTLTAVGAGCVEGRLRERWQPETEPRVSLWLAMALLKGEKPEWVIQKGTELGVSGFLLMETARTIVTAESDRWETRRERYRRVAVEAAEQCGRVRIPTIEGPLSFVEAVARAAAFDRALLAHEGGRLHPVRALADCGPGGSAFQPAPCAVRSVLLLVGPEGGFTPEEVAAAEAAAITSVTLGRRVLRSETAALVLATLTLSLLDQD